MIIYIYALRRDNSVHMYYINMSLYMYVNSLQMYVYENNKY